MKSPKNPSIPTGPHSPGKQQHPPSVDLDPKHHPIHREAPTQPIHEGTDPKKPVRRGGDGVS